MRTSNVWGEASYGHMHLDGTTPTDSAGFTLGADGKVSSAARLGFAAGYSGTRGKGMQAGTASGFLYGMYVYKSWAFTGSAGYLFTKFDLKDQDVKLDAHSGAADAYVNYDFGGGFTGVGGARYFQTHTKKTKMYQFDDVSATTLVGGLKFSAQGKHFGVHADINAVYDVHADKSDYRIKRNGDIIKENGSRLHRAGGEAGIGASYTRGAWTIDADYFAQVRKDFADQSVMLKINYAF